jgi:hypothetical protein
MGAGPGSISESGGGCLMAEQQRELRIPEDLCVRAEQKFGSRFGNLEELICHVLGELLRDDALRMDQAEEQIIEERLRDLGYI